MSKKAKLWLLSELPALVRDGLLRQEQADGLRERYAVPESARGSLTYVVCGLVGALLVGLGIILLLAHNWENLSRAAKTAWAVGPLLAAQGLAGWVLLKRADSVAWREGAGAFLFLMVGSCLALIGQTYHLPGDMASLLSTWMLLALPVGYLLRASVPFVLYLGLAVWWSMEAQMLRGYAVWYWPLLLAVLPHYVWAVRRSPFGARASIVGWGLCLALCIGTGLALENVVPGIWILVYAALFAAMYLAGDAWQSGAPTVWQRPLKWGGAIGAACLTLLLTYRWCWDSVGWHHYRHGWSYNSLAAVSDYLVLGVMLAVAVVLFIRRLAKGWDWGLLYAALPVPIGLGYVVAAEGREPFTSAMLMNLYGLVLAVALLVRGFRNDRLREVNEGMAILSGLILLRFFDSGLDFTARGVAFVLVGAGFLAANLILVRRKGGVS